jgi:hypothetical protein
LDEAKLVLSSEQASRMSTKPQAIPVVPDFDAAHFAQWSRALSSYSVIAMFIPVLLPVVFIFGIGAQTGDLQLGETFRELLQASRSLFWYRILMVLDIATWLAFSGTLLLIGGLVRKHAPILGYIASWCAAGMTIGIMTGLLRIAFVGALAASYGADPGARGEVIGLFRTGQPLLDLPSQAGTVLLCIGYAAAAGALWSLRGFPKWLSIWTAVPAVASLIQIGHIVLGQGFILPLVVTNNVLGYSGLCLAMALVLRQGRRNQLPT